MNVNKTAAQLERTGDTTYRGEERNVIQFDGLAGIGVVVRGVFL